MHARIARTAVTSLGLVALWFVVAPAPAHAYLDPGSGSLILQAVVAAFFGGLLFFKSRWRQIRSRFGRGQADQEKPGAEDD